MREHSVRREVPGPHAVADELLNVVEAVLEDFLNGTIFDPSGAPLEGGGFVFDCAPIIWIFTLDPEGNGKTLVIPRAEGYTRNLAALSFNVCGADGRSLHIEAAKFMKIIKRW